MVDIEEIEKLNIVYAQMIKYAKKEVEKLKKEKEKLRSENEKLKKQTTTDELTGLPNKLFVYELLKKEIPRVIRNNGNLSIGYLDINDFKKINDIHGHDIGDKVIIYFANTLNNILRESDIVARPNIEDIVDDSPKNMKGMYNPNIGDKFKTYSANTVNNTSRKVNIVEKPDSKDIIESSKSEDVLARLHGDELIFIFLDTNKDSACYAMERVMNDIKPYSKNGKLIKVNASYGVAQFNKSDYPDNMPIENIIENLIKEADKKMYEHKRSKNTKN